MLLAICAIQQQRLDNSGYRVLGVLSYDGIDSKEPAIGVAGETTNPFYANQNPHNDLVWEGCNDMPLDMVKPTRKEAAYGPAANNTHYIEYEFLQAQNMNRIFVNKTSWAPLENNATIWKLERISNGTSVAGGYDNFGQYLNQQILTNPDANGSVQLVINSLDAMQHPWHLHGHEFQIFGWGQGLYGQDDTQWRLENPMRRDTITISTNWHVVLRWRNDNLGIWAMHW
jgi:FtsP/CotA-like multicopper oxidase with cupredoxin domain